MSKKLRQKLEKRISALDAVKLSMDEDFINDFFLKLKYSQGMSCSTDGCDSKEFTFIKSRELYQCKKCQKQISIKANTIFHKSKVPLSTWFLAIYFLVDGEYPKISVMDLAGKLGVSYKCATLIKKKLAKAMKDANSKYLLNGVVQFDDSSIGASDRETKQGKGSTKQSFVCGLSLCNGIFPNYLKLALNKSNSHTSTTYNAFAKALIEINSKIICDANPAYKILKENYDLDMKVVSHSKKNPQNEDQLKWLDIIISNLKAYIQGVFHGIQKLYLEFEFSVFEWIFNRRKISTLNKIKSLVNTCFKHDKFSQKDYINYYQPN